jgi:adenylate cyclase
MDLLRTFHTEVERAVFAQGGMVDKFMGDGVMACFGVPDPVTSASADALRAAMALLKALAAPLPDGSGHGLAVGIGLHRGPVLMGNLGGSVQVQFTVVGDAVNVASRLEALTRAVGTPLIVSETVLAAARPHLEPALLAHLQPLPEVALRGRAEPIRAWRLADADTAAPM